MSDLPPPPTPPPSAPLPPPPPTAGYGYAPGPVADYGSIGARFGAAIIDGLITGAFTIPAWIALTTGPTKTESCSVDNEGNIDFGGADNALCEVPTGGTWALFAVLLTVGVIGTVLYYVTLVSNRGQTVGKRAVGVKVVDAESGELISKGRAFGRYLMGFVSSAVCALGYLWALWDPKKQTWHDKAASTVVVRA